MNMNFDVNKIFQNRLASSMGLDKYQYIMKKVREINVSYPRYSGRTAFAP